MNLLLIVVNLALKLFLISVKALPVRGFEKTYSPFLGKLSSIEIKL